MATKKITFTVVMTVKDDNNILNSTGMHSKLWSALDRAAEADRLMDDNEELTLLDYEVKLASVV